MRVEGPGRAVEFNWSTQQTVRQEPVERSPDATVREASVQPVGGKTVESFSEKPVDKKSLEAAVEVANKAMDISSYNLEFEIHDDSGRVQVKVVDAESKEVIREIPAEEMLDLAASIKDMLENMDKMVGVLVNKLV